MTARATTIRFVFQFLFAFLAILRVFFRSRQEAALEILALRQQVAVLKRKRPRPRLSAWDRLFWTMLRQVWSRWAEVAGTECSLMPTTTVRPGRIFPCYPPDSALPNHV